MLFHHRHHRMRGKTSRGDGENFFRTSSDTVTTKNVFSGLMRFGEFD